MLGTDLVLLLALLLAHGRDLLTCTHGPAQDVQPPTREAVLRHQPPAGEAADAWPHIHAAAGLLKDLFEESPERPSDADLPPSFIFETLLSEARWPDGAGREVLRREAEWALGEFGRRDGPAMLERAAAAHRSEPPARLHVIALDTMEPDAWTHLASLVRVSRVRAALAAQHGDWAKFMEGIGHVQVCARVAAQQGSTIGRMGAAVMSGVGLAQIREAIMEHPDLPEPVLAALLGQTEQLELWPPRAASLEGIRAEFISLTARLYTPGGAPLLSEIHGFTSNFLGWAVRADRAEPRPPELINLLGVAYASRTQTLAALDRALAELASVIDRPHVKRERVMREHRASLASPRHATSRELIDFWLNIHDTWLQEEDLHALHLTGTRIMLALELHHRERGRYPAALHELVPEFLPDLPRFPALPPDPISGLPLVYRPIDAAADPHGRGYLLYSVGADGVDDGGRVSRLPSAALRRPEDRPESGGTDYILNSPRPKR